MFDFRSFSSGVSFLLIFNYYSTEPVFFFEIKPQANITETRCPIRYQSRDEAFQIFLTGAIWYMLFCIYEVFEAVDTAGLSLKVIRYCFGLKRNPSIQSQVYWLIHYAYITRNFYVRLLLLIG